MIMQKGILYYANITVFQFSTSFGELPDRQNLPLFNDMLQFWYQSRETLFVLWDFSCHSKQFLLL